MIQTQPKDSDPSDVENNSAQKPLLLPQDSSDKQVNITVTSMDSALSNSDNCSDIELENIHKNTVTIDSSSASSKNPKSPLASDPATTVRRPATPPPENPNSTASPGRDAKTE